MRQISLTQGKFAIVDDDDYEVLSSHKWLAEKKQNTFYASRKIGPANSRRTVYMHRQIMGTPPEMKVDHINGDGLDNRRCNIRNCSHAQNMLNRGAPKNSATGYKGVMLKNNLKSNPYHARITFNGKIMHIGYYPTAESAAIAYDTKAKEYFGEFAWTNF